MTLTKDQRAAVVDQHDRMLAACPGSGKTKVIVSKLVRLIDEIRGTPRCIGCITYTNTAVYEIEARTRIHLQPDDDRYFDISTIHAFCLNNIFRPFRHLVPGFKNGFKVLTQESEEFEGFVRSICSAYGRHNLNYYDYEEFTKLRTDLNGAPTGEVIQKGSITAPMARDFWTLIQKHGFIDFANIIYKSYRLLRDHPHILAYVCSRYQWILVDEFQDTSDLQVEMLGLIAAKGRTKLFLVGDSYQSIFAFAGARPDLADVFASKLKAKTDIRLVGNFRSSQLIVDDAERLLPRVPAMVAVGENRTITQDSQWFESDSNLALITGHFLPMLEELEIPLGKAAVLAPIWATLYGLGRQLRKAGIPIVGPGARPYRRSRQFAPLAEAVCGYLMEPRSESLHVLERTLFHTLLDITGRHNFNIFTYNGRRVIFELLEAAKSLQAKHTKAIDWLKDASVEFTAILFRHEYFSPTEKEIFPSAVAAMNADIINNKLNPNDLTIEDLGVYASPNAALKLSSIHNSKGREYDAVALIDLHERSIPTGFANTPEAVAEQQRLFYVGVTRAKKYLMYGTTAGHSRGPSRFIYGVGFQKH